MWRIVIVNMTFNRSARISEVYGKFLVWWTAFCLEMSDKEEIDSDLEQEDETTTVTIDVGGDDMLSINSKPVSIKEIF